MVWYEYDMIKPIVIIYIIKNVTPTTIRIIYGSLAMSAMSFPTLSNHKGSVFIFQIEIPCNV